MSVIGPYLSKFGSQASVLFGALPISWFLTGWIGLERGKDVLAFLLFSVDRNPLQSHQSPADDPQALGIEEFPMKSMRGEQGQKEMGRAVQEINVHLEIKMRERPRLQYERQEMSLEKRDCTVTRKTGKQDLIEVSERRKTDGLTVT